MKLLASGVGATAAVWGGFYLHPSPPPGQYDFWDKLIVWEIAVSFTFGAVVMLLSRKTWTFRGVGLLLASVGIAILFLLAGVIAELGVTRGDVPPGTILPTARMDPGIREGWQDLARAFLSVGGAGLFVGLFFWTIGRFGAHAYLGDVLGSPPRYSPDSHPGRRLTDADFDEPGYEWIEPKEATQ